MEEPRKLFVVPFCRARFGLDKSIVVLLILILLFMGFNNNVLNSRTNVLSVKQEIPLVSSFTPLDTPNPTEMIDFLDNYIANQLSRYLIAGMTVSVVKDNELMLAKGYGFSDLSPPSQPVIANQTLFRIGSVSKTFTAVAVLQLVEDGILDLDTDVNNYLTAFKIPETYQEPITLRHLLTHSAGFEELAFEILYDSPDDLLPLEDVLANGIPDRMAPPGEITGYSNYGLSLAGYIVQEMSGKPFEQYIEDEILTPLGMNHTTFRQPLPSELENDMSTGYDENGDPASFEYVSVAPAGSCSSTAEDMAKFMIALLDNGHYNGAQILQNDTMQMMQEEHFTTHPNLPGVNLGLYEMDINNVHIIGHGGDTILFHSTMALFPEEKFGFFISYNSYEALYANIEFFGVFMSSFYPYAGETITPIQDYDKGLNEFTGHYVHSRRHYSDKVIQMDNETITVKAHDFLEVAYEISTNKGYLRFEGINLDFVQVEPDYFREATGQYDLEMAFIRDSKGQVRHFYANFIGPVLAFEKIHPIYEESTALFIILIVVGSIYLLSFCWWGIDAILKRRKGKEKDAVPPSIARWLVVGVFVVTAVIITIVLVMSYSKIMLDTETLADLNGWIALPIIDLLLIGGLLVFSGLSWIGIGNIEKKPYWRLWERIQYTVLTLLTFACIWCFAYWHFLGY